MFTKRTKGERQINKKINGLLRIGKCPSASQFLHGHTATRTPFAKNMGMAKI